MHDDDTTPHTELSARTSSTIRKKMTRRTKLALWLLLGPTILIFTTFLTFAVVNLASGNIPQTLPAACVTETGEQSITNISTECQAALTSLQSPLERVINVILYLILTVAMLAWLPGLIAGAILLIKKPKQ